MDRRNLPETNKQEISLFSNNKGQKKTLKEQKQNIKKKQTSQALRVEFELSLTPPPIKN